MGIESFFYPTKFNDLGMHSLLRKMFDLMLRKQIILFSSQCTENPPFRFFWDTRYSYFSESIRDTYINDQIYWKFEIADYIFNTSKSSKSITRLPEHLYKKIFLSYLLALKRLLTAYIISTSQTQHNIQLWGNCAAAAEKSNFVAPEKHGKVV